MTPSALDSDPKLIVRKVAWRILPLLCIAYVINYLDRVNISFAKLQMAEYLGLDDMAFGIGAGVFFIGYFVFEVPSNIILERLGARRWIPIIMIFWGGATALLAWVSTPWQFYLVRFLIGFAEAGFFPGVVLYTTYWFPAVFRARVMGLIIASTAAAGIIGGPLCGGIMEGLDGFVALAGWQWLMLATGLPAMVVGVLIYLVLPNRPEEARWLAPAEREVLNAHLGQDTVRKSSLRDGILNRWSWNCAGILFLLTCAAYAISFWLPSLLADTGLDSAAEIGWLVAIPYSLGVLGMLAITHHSDNSQERRWHLTACFVLIALGLALSAANSLSAAGIILGMSLALAGCLSAIPLMWTLPPRLMPAAGLAVGIAIVNTFGNLGGFFAPVLIGKVSVETGDMASGFWWIAMLLLAGAGWVAFTLRGAAARG